MIKTAILSLVLFYSFSAFAAGGNHQIGEEFGKEQITIDSLESHPFFLNSAKNRSRQIAEATAWLTHPFHGSDHFRIPEGTTPEGPWTPKHHGRYIGSAHLLGKFEGSLIMMTNSHLIHEKDCSDVTIKFVFLEGQPEVDCREVIIRDELIDYALLRVEAKAEAVSELLEQKGVNLDYRYRLRKGERIYTIGASHLGANKSDRYRRTPREFYLTRDEDCRILSRRTNLIRNTKKATEDFKPRHSFSFANGCDAFLAGDCGAVYVSEETGKIIGTYWTEGEESPKTPVSEILARKGDRQFPELWNKFTYGVPAFKIRQRMLRSPLAKEDDYRSLFQAIFN